ncbi:MAG: hypothetical protein M1272_08495 [Firmicutes bacterium]|nr:hypothetical protein [Bacillota bacterium]
MIAKWLNQVLHRTKKEAPRVEYEEITIRLTTPIPPAGSGVILNNRDWKRAVEEQRRREAVDPR